MNDSQELTFEHVRAEIMRLQREMIAAKKQPKLPRLFTLSYDRTKLKSRNPVTRLDYQGKLTLWGTEYPPTDLPGGVGMQNGDWFRDLQELRDHYESIGSYTLSWLDEQAEVDE